jgi:nondiscriminating glutamyl-tRNA synthetase
MKKRLSIVSFSLFFELVYISLSGYKNDPDKSKLEEERQALILSRRMPHYMGKCLNLTPEQRKEKEVAGRKPSFRFTVPDATIGFTDLIRGPMKFEGTAMGDFIIVRSNGMPAYNFAVPGMVPSGY